MSIASRLLRAAFVWAVTTMFLTLLAIPVGHLLGGGPVQVAFGVALAILVGGSLLRATVALSRDLVTGRYDAERPRATPPVRRAPARRRRWLANLVVLGLSTLVTVAALELVFRTFFPQPLYAVEFAPWGFWHMRDICFVHGAEPKYEKKILRGTEFVTHVCYNSFGMRDRERSVEKPEGVKRILVLGDSFGEGMEVEFEQTAGQVLERMLNADIARLRHEPSSSDPGTPRTEAPAAPDSPQWAATRPIFKALRDEAATAGSKILVAGVHWDGPEWELRRRWFEASGIEWVNVTTPPEERIPGLYTYRLDGHWNPVGHERAARLIYQKIVGDGLLRSVNPVREVEVINASMSAFSQCKELAVYRALGRQFSPDLVLVIYTAADERNVDDQDMCGSDAFGELAEFRPRTFSPAQYALRTIRALVRSRSHFGTWVMERLDTIPLVTTLRIQLQRGQEQIRFIEPD